jgi:hypothetical protein
MKTITSIIYPAFAAFALCCVAFLPKAQAVTPAPDGFYPGFNTAEGQNALSSLNTSTGLANTAVGWSSLSSDVNGQFNTAIGAGTLLFNTGDPNTGDGIQNTAVGGAALLLNTTGARNTAVGASALLSNTTGSDNTAVGIQALTSNTTGFVNTATGRLALLSNTTGQENTADGASALKNNTIGNHNTAVGRAALLSNTEGIDNTGLGWWALLNNTTGSQNTAVGGNALSSNTTGFLNTAVGQGALLSADAGNNIALGDHAGANLTTGGNNIDIGNAGVADESNTIRIGDPSVQTATYIVGINGATATGGAAVFVNSDGQLGTLTSSARFKTAIKPMDESSEAILALKPVAFRYKQEIDPKGIPQFGLVAEEVEKVNPDLVSRDRDGKPYTVRYEAVNAMLLNEFLKARRQLQGLKEIVADQQKQIKALTSGLQKVSAQVQLSKPAPQTVSLPAVALREGGNNQ